MKGKWLKVGILALVVALIGLAAAVAYAQGPRGSQGWYGADYSLVAVAAEKLGLEQADLAAQLRGGKTIAELAEEKGVALETIVDAFIAPHAERMASLVESKWLTQEQADARLALMKAHVTTRLSQPFTAGVLGYGWGMHGGMGYGMGRGMMPGWGMHGGMGYGMGPGMGMGFADANGDGIGDFCPFAQPSTTPGASS